MESKMCTAFERLSAILDQLRKECPWDRKQTLKSLRYLTIEEVFELSEAILSIEQDADKPSAPHIEAFKKELGDIAMHILFYCKIAEEKNLFSTADVYNSICEKLIDRHPFIYQKEAYHGESWEEIKMHEGRTNVLEGVPASLPTLTKTIRMQEKVSGINPDVLKEKLPDTIVLSDDMSEQSFGGLLFSLVNWARQHGINADDALSISNTQFYNRFASTSTPTSSSPEA